MRSVVPKTIRKHSGRVLAPRIVKSVRNHPANSAAPRRAVVRAVQWQVRKRLGSGDVEIDAYGFRLRLPRQSGSLSNYFYFGEAFEWQTINFIRSYLRLGDHVVDVGANVGIFTYAAAQVVGPEGRVHSFEPLPWAAEAIRRNVESSGLGMVVVYEVAASDSAGTAEFTSSLDVSSHFVWEAGAVAPSPTISVRTGPLDDELGQDEALALAKIDVEGAEMRVLGGFKRALAVSNPPVIIVEAHDHSLRKLGSSKAEVVQMLETAEYAMFAFDVDTGRLDPAGPGSVGDLIAVAASHLAAVHTRLEESRTAKVDSLDSSGRLWR